MAPSHPLDNLRTNADLAVVLKRALRLVQEIGDITFSESPRTDRMRLEQHLDRRLGEAQTLMEALGIRDVEAKKLVSKLLFEMQEAWGGLVKTDSELR